MGDTGLDELEKELAMVWVAVEVVRDHRYGGIEDNLHDLGHHFTDVHTQLLEGLGEECQDISLA